MAAAGWGRWLGWSAALAVLAACESQPAEPSHEICQTDAPLAGAKWQVLLDPEVSKGALFSVWGSTRTDVWAVGAADQRYADLGPQVLHFDGKAWTRLKSGAAGELWWVSPGAAKGVLWMAGSGGQVVRKNADHSFTVMHAPSSTQLYGIFALSDSDVYAVGGVAGCAGGVGCGVIWHYDGKGWGMPPGLDSKLSEKATWFKAWGSGSELWVVGSDGQILHRGPAGWSAQASGATDTILTVAGNAKLRIAVGGFGSGLLLEDAGAGWQVGKFQGQPPGLNGVSVPADGRAAAVGFGGAVWRRCDGKWLADPGLQNLGAGADLHGVWKAPTGEVFAVGGNIMTPPFAEGALVYYGAPIAVVP
ncbi:MAG: hypothetical protein HY902_03045 [Deltaproteobacteria bacterium]|nr:hypothetical protein [Deltaproteobacteria bacterium]